ncbi:MAG: DUF3427 domain-containing protein [bacterium]|nr:DUF3427 domain-containing protein [bacterium]
MQVFEIENKYTKKDIYEILNVSKSKQKGSWDTGYRKYNNDIYIFANIGTEGRTGHDYTNYWDGDQLHWQAKSNSNINQPLIRDILDVNRNGAVHIFTRTENRDAFIYEGAAVVNNFEDTQPVKIVWTFPSITTNLMRPELSPNEISSKFLVEGTGKKITVNKYERNPLARRKCIEFHGPKCKVCDIDFEEKYGSIGKGFIHVHHKVPIAQIGDQYTIDPINDLVPVCPNCHAMLHRSSPVLSVEELKAVLNNNP